MRYDLMAQEALRGVIRAALSIARRDGLPGDHHFYIAFNTNDPDVKISERLHERYPNEMTIVLQHQFWGLEVEDTFFAVELSFDNIPEKLIIPYHAIKGFFDPAVQFGLQFETGEANENVEAAETPDEAARPEATPVPTPAQTPNEATPAIAAKEPAQPEIGAVETGVPNTVEADNSNVVHLDVFRKE